jgi:hypothetical protein
VASDRERLSGELSLLDDEIAKSNILLDDMHRVQSEDDSGDRATSASRRTFIDSLGEHIGRANRARRRVAGELAELDAVAAK